MISAQIYPLIQLIPFVIYNILRKLYYIVAAIAINCLGAKVDIFWDLENLKIKINRKKYKSKLFMRNKNGL